MGLIDFHCDTFMHLLKNNDMHLNSNSLSIDINKLKKGNSIAQFFAMFIGLKDEENPLEACLKMIDKFYCEVDLNKASIAIAKNYEDVIKNKNDGKISAFLTIEEGGVLKGSLYNLRNFYRLGVRLITLSWNYPNELGFPNYKMKYSNQGLTQFGMEVVNEMNSLRMLVDVSHLSDKGFYDVASISTKPFIASHSNARSVTNHPRNLTDDMIKIIAEKGGVMGLNFCSSFLGDPKVSRIEDMVKHLKHIRNIGGADVMAIGTDFDGISSDLQIKDTGEMNLLYSAMEKAGFSQEDMDKAFYKNAIRIIKDVL